MSVHPAWRDLLRDAAQQLGAAGVEGPLRDARLLLGHALGMDAAALIAAEQDQVTPERRSAFADLVARRAAGEPVSRIRGWREFHGLRFAISPAVLDPRPETELLVDEGLKRLPAGGRVLDLGCGSGCILISLLAERADATGVGVDLSPEALAIAQTNADALGVADRITFVEGGWSAGGEGFDLIVSNPPYIRADDIVGLAREVKDHDPRLALSGGPDGLGPYREIPRIAARTLRPGGWLGLEFGQGQDEAVMAEMEAAGLTNVAAMADTAGILRVAFGRMQADSQAISVTPP